MSQEIKKTIPDESKYALIDGSKSPETARNKAIIRGIPLLNGRPVRVRKVDDARRLLSRLILEFQKGSIGGQAAKDLCYLVISYVNVAVQTDLESRLSKLEEGYRRGQSQEANRSS